MMNTTIVFNLESERRVFENIKNRRKMFFTDNQKDAFMYHIDHVNVDSYIINPSGMNTGKVKSMIEQIKYLNALITIIIYKPTFEFPSQFTNDRNVILIKSGHEIPSHLNEISNINRNSNRVHWPLQVNYWKPENREMTLKKAKVLSVSSSGCFIGTNTQQVYKTDDPVSIIFTFKGFDFYSDGTVVRLEGTETSTTGMAIAFKEVSHQTQAFITKIIDEKILSDIMKTIE